MRFSFIQIICFIGLFLSGCTLGTKTEKSLKKNLDQYYQSSGVASYFLSELPDWANFSEAGRCMRSGRVKYVNIKNMMESFGLDYYQLLHFQFSFNIEYVRLNQLYENKNLFLKNEESLFYDVLDKIKSGIYAFRKPKFERVNLIWIDPILNEADYDKGLAKLFSRNDIVSGHPVIISMCKDYHTLVDVFKKLNLEKFDARIISSEMFSIFLEDGSSEFSFLIKIKGLFSPEQKLHLFAPEKNVPKEIIGEYKLEKL